MNLKAIFRGTLLAIVLVFLSLLIGALFVYFDVLKEKTVSIAVFCAATIGVFIGAYGVARTSEHKLLLNTLGVGFGFALVIFLTSLFINSGFTLHTRTLSLIGGGFAAAFLGALFGK